MCRLKTLLGWLRSLLDTCVELSGVWTCNNTQFDSYNLLFSQYFCIVLYIYTTAFVFVSIYLYLSQSSRFRSVTGHCLEKLLLMYCMYILSDTLWMHLDVVYHSESPTHSTNHLQIGIVRRSLNEPKGYPLLPLNVLHLLLALYIHQLLSSYSIHLILWFQQPAINKHRRPNTQTHIV